MPPKKKKSGKKGKKGKGSKKGSRKQSAVAREEQSLDESSKEYYLMQIRNLEGRILRYQRKCDELEVMNKNILDKFDQLGTEKHDIVAFLKKSLDQRLDEIADLNDRIVGLQQAKDVEKEAYEAQLQQLRTEFQETKDQLTSENMILSGKLASLEEFKVQREELMAKFARLEEALVQKERDHQEHIYQLERKQVIDKDALKKEIVVRVNQVAAEFRKLSNKQMAETTKRTIRENAAINAQLQKMSEKTSEIISENDETRKTDKQLKMQLEMQEEHEHDVMRKNASNQKLIKMLLEKCKQQEMILNEYEEREKEYGLVKANESGARNRLEELAMQLDDLRGEKQSSEMRVDELNARKTELEQRVREQQQLQAQLESTLAEAVLAVKDILSLNDIGTDYSQVELKTKHDKMLEKLLLVLNSSVSSGVGPRMHEFASRRKAEETPRTQPSGFLRQTKAASAAAHYRLGQLGFVPAEDSKFPVLLEKVPLLSSTTKYKLNKLDQLLA